MTTFHPIQYASGYCLDLYCDRINPKHPYGSFPNQYTGETFGECAKAARKEGWVLHRKTRTATCPTCTKMTSIYGGVAGGGMGKPK